jgi:membrane protein YdbS with pleckstrin-like domain
VPEGAAYCESCGQPVAPTTITTAPQLIGAAGAAAAAAVPPAQPPLRSAAASREAGRRGADDYGVYALIRRDQSPLAQETLQLLDATNMSVHPRLSAYLASMLHPMLRFLVLAVIALATAYFLKAHIPWPYLLLLLVVPAVIVGAKLIEVKTTTVTLEAGRLLITKGVFAREAHNLELYRVLDIALERSLLNRLTGDGTLVLTIEGIHGTQDPFRLPLPGLARIDDLEQLFTRLRSLVLLLRTGPWGKGFIS